MLERMASGTENFVSPGVGGTNRRGHYSDLGVPVEFKFDQNAGVVQSRSA